MSPEYKTINGLLVPEKKLITPKPASLLMDISDVDFPQWSTEKMSETYRITDEIFNQLSDEAVVSLFNGLNEKDIDLMTDQIIKETYSVLYNNENRRSIDSSNLGYIDALTDSVEETLRVENIAYFVLSVLEDFDVQHFHLDWFDIIMRYRLTCILCARDTGKSYTFSNAYPIWEMYRMKKTEKNRRGFLFSFSIQQAIDLMQILKDTIEDNDILRERLYNKENWSKTDITCKNRARLTVKGFGSSVRGAHPAWAVVDDGLKENSMYSEEQRNKTINYFHSVIMNMIVPKGKVRVVGTPFHSEDLYADLKNKPVWRYYEYPGIFPNGEVLYPNRWDYEGLIEKRAIQGNLIFSREILCRPITSDSTIFPIEILRNAIYKTEQLKLVNNRESFPIKFNQVVCGCDFAISANVGADFSVFTTWGIDDQERMWLLNIFREKGLSFAAQMEKLKQINTNFRPDLMVFEDNVFQKIFVEEARKYRLPVRGHTTGVEKNDLRNGWAGLSIAFETGKIKMPYGDEYSRSQIDMMFTEFSSVAFTEKGIASTSGHDDTVSSTFLGIQAAKQLAVSSFNFAMV